MDEDAGSAVVELGDPRVFARERGSLAILRERREAPAAQPRRVSASRAAVRRRHTLRTSRDSAERCASSLSSSS